MYLTRKHLMVIIAWAAFVIVVLALSGCGKINPPWGGSAW